MGYPTKVQLIKRRSSEQWYINFPSAVAQAMEFERGEVCEWIIEDLTQLVLRRTSPPESAMKKKQRPGCLRTSRTSSGKAATRSARRGSSQGQESTP
jgi:hypothetical protein